MRTDTHQVKAAHSINGQAERTGPTTSYRTGRQSRQDYRSYVWGYAGRHFLYAFVAGSAALTTLTMLFLLLASPGYLVDWWIVWILAMSAGLASGGWAARTALEHAQDRWDENNIYERYEYGQPTEVVLPKRPVNNLPRKVKVNDEPIVLDRQDKTLAYAKHSFTFSGKQLDQLLSWYKNGHSSIRKISSTVGPGFDKAGIKSTNYTIAHAVLTGRGMIDNNNEWTAKGVAWLEQE